MGKMRPDFSQRCVVKQQEAMVRSYNVGNSD